MNESSIKISVVIPSYNAAKTIQRAVDSVLAQSYPAFEIIVVDDGSLDDTTEVVGQYGNALRLIQQPNSRTATARNVGIESTQGEWIAFLDADDFWDSGKLAKQVKIINQNLGIGLIAGAYYTQCPGRPEVVVSSSVPASWFERVLTSSNVDAFLLGTRVWTGTVLVRRETLGEERFVSGLEPAEDRDLWVRLASKASVWLMSEPLATCVLESGSISRVDIRKDCRAMLAVIDRHKEQMGVLNRLVWRSYTFYRWAAMEPKPMTGLRLLLQSFWTWPASLSGMPTMQTWGRSRRLLRIGRNLISNVVGRPTIVKSGDRL